MSFCEVLDFKNKSDISDINTIQQSWTPNNFQKSKGICIDDALYDTEWLVPAGVVATRDTTNKLFESGSINFNIDDGGGWYSMTKAINYDFTNVTTIAIAFYVEDERTYNGFTFRLTTDATKVGNTNNWTKYFESNTTYTSTKIHSGWNFMKFHKNYFTNTGGETWGLFRAIRILPLVPALKFNNEYTLNNGAVVGSANVKVGGIYLDPQYETPKFLLNFDDSLTSMFTIGFPYMRSKGIKSTLFVCKNHTNEITAASGYMTLAQHQEWYNSGNDIGSHSTSHPDVWALTEAQMISEFGEAIQFLVDNGWTRAKHCLAYPMARYNTTCLNVVKNLGIKIGRGRNVGRIGHVTSDEMLILPTYEITGTSTLADVTGHIDRCLLFNESMSLFTHGIVASGPDAYSTTTAIFTGLIDYLVAKRDAGLIEILTYSEFYDRLTNKTITVPTITTT